MLLLRVAFFVVPMLLGMAACTSASREGLPPGSPFADQALSGQELLPYGTAVGDVTNRSAVLWLRTEGPKAVQIVYASREAWEKMSALASVQVPASRTSIRVTRSEHDFTLTIPLEGLAPETAYRFQILVDDPLHTAEALGTVAMAGEFTTLPEPTRSVPVTFAWSGDLGGQHHCRRGPSGYPLFDAIRAQRPDFFLFLGDTIYSDDVCPSPPNEPGADFMATALPEYRARQRYQRGALGLRRFLESIPVYVIWDDHEVKNNFAGSVETQMPAGRQALREYWPIASPPEDPNRLYRSVRYGADLELFILDTRQYRSSNADPDGPNKTMLGAAQLQWLLKSLSASTATWRVVATSVPLSIPKGGGESVPGNDGWAGGPDGTGFERERQVIVEAILTQRLKNVVFLGGDVHYVQANAYDPDRDGTVDFHEFIAGPLSARPGRMTRPSPALNPTNLVHEGGYFNFGLVRVTGSTLEVTVIDEVGKTRFAHTIKAR